MKLKVIFLSFVIFTFLLNGEITRKRNRNNFVFFNGKEKIAQNSVNGQVKAYFDSTKVKGVFNYKAGKLDGEQKEFYQDGKLQAKYTMKDGKRDGNGEEYFADGKTVSFRRNLKNGNGLGIEYYQNGMKKRERLYSDGKQIRYSKLNYDIKGNRFPRTASELYAEAQNYAVEGLYYHAIKGFNEFLTKYPKNEKAPNVLFLIAFTYNNQLQDAENAKKTYEEFLKKYPNNDLANSAKFEIQNLGKSIDNLPGFKKENKK